MNIKILFPLVLLSALLVTPSMFSQASKDARKQKSLQHVSYGENINAPLTSKELQQIEEVYGDHAEKYILSKPQRLKDVKHILRNRVVIAEYPKKDLSSFTSLSTVTLFNYYNKSITRDVAFDANTFNPLKYQFHFYSREGSKTYRFDNSQYLITIKPQNPQ